MSVGQRRRTRRACTMRNASTTGYGSHARVVAGKSGTCCRRENRAILRSLRGRARGEYGCGWSPDTCVRSVCAGSIFSCLTFRMTTGPRVSVTCHRPPCRLLNRRGEGLRSRRMTRTVAVAFSPTSSASCSAAARRQTRFGGGPMPYVVIETDGNIQANDALQGYAEEGLGESGLDVSHHEISTNSAPRGRSSVTCSPASSPNPMRAGTVRSSRYAAAGTCPSLQPGPCLQQSVGVVCRHPQAVWLCARQARRASAVTTG